MDSGRDRRSRRILVVTIAAAFLVGCTSSTSSTGPAMPGQAPSPSPAATLSASATLPATAVPTPTASPTPSATASRTPVPTAAVKPGCPTPPVSLAKVRDLARAGKAVGCFGSTALTFRAYVPTTEGLGGVSGSKMTPTWIADNWTGAILQPGPLADQDQDAWLIVRVPPSLGRCSITEVTATDCPFGAHLEGYVTVTGHFDDPVATKCKSVAFSPELDPGPSKSKMVARCRTQFVVSAIKPG